MNKNIKPKRNCRIVYYPDAALGNASSGTLKHNKIQWIQRRVVSFNRTFQFSTTLNFIYSLRECANKEKISLVLCSVRYFLFPRLKTTLLKIRLKYLRRKWNQLQYIILMYMLGLTQDVIAKFELEKLLTIKRLTIR